MSRLLLVRVLVAALTLGAVGRAAEPAVKKPSRRAPFAQRRDTASGHRCLGARAARIPGAASALVGQLGDKSARVRVHAADALGQIGPQARPSAKAIGELLRDPNLHVRRAAVRALRKIRPDPQVSIPLLMKGMDDADSAVRIGALDGLAECGKAAVQPLTEALGREKTAHFACMALGEIGPEAAPAVPALVELLKKDPRPEIRREAALTLGAIGEAAEMATPQLIEALGDADQGIRMGAVFAIGRIGPVAEMAAKPLQKMSGPQSPPLLRTLSLSAQARINPNDKQLVQRAVPPLVEAMRSREPRVRVTAASALVDLNAPPEMILPAMKRILSEGNPDMMAGALRVMGGLGATAVPSLTEALRIKDAQAGAALMLGRLGPEAKQAIPNLAELVTSGDPAARHEALMALGAMGPAAGAAAPTAAAALEDQDLRIRYAACYALGRMGVVAAAAKPALQRGLEHSDPFLGLACASALRASTPTARRPRPSRCRC